MCYKLKIKFEKLLYTFNLQQNNIESKKFELSFRNKKQTFLFVFNYTTNYKLFVIQFFCCFKTCCF